LPPGAGTPARGVFGRKEAPVEARVVGDEHRGIQCSSETGHDVPETGATGNHAVSDAGEPRHPQGNRVPGSSSASKARWMVPPLEDGYGHLEDPTADLGPHAGRFHVHDGEAGVLEDSDAGLEVIPSERQGHAPGTAATAHQLAAVHRDHRPVAVVQPLLSRQQALGGQPF